MSVEQAPASRETDVNRSVAEFYAAWTMPALRRNPRTLSIHRGLWGPDTKNNDEAMERANRMLVEGCSLGPGQHVLDAGCGLGGTAIDLAETYGVQVTGLTICEPHVALAARKAEERGVGHLVRFVHGDFMDLPFPDASFDAVLNQESFCYVHGKRAYLRAVHRVLKPGGRWQALDGELLSGVPMSEQQRALVAAVERDWRLAPIVPWRDVLTMLEDAGFANIVQRDLSAETLPWWEETRKGFMTISFLYPELRQTHPARQEFMDAAMLAVQGLREGLFTYRLIAGIKPA